MEKVLFQDYSPEDRLDMIVEQRDKLIDDVLHNIEAICPEIPIIEV